MVPHVWPPLDSTFRTVSPLTFVSRSMLGVLNMSAPLPNNHLGGGNCSNAHFQDDLSEVLRNSVPQLFGNSQDFLLPELNVSLFLI